MDANRLSETFFGPVTLVEMVRHRALHQPDNVAFTFLPDGENEQLHLTNTELPSPGCIHPGLNSENEQLHLTNTELDRRARAIAAWLTSMDLSGERALLLYPPGLEFIAALFGCIYAGVTAVPVCPPQRNQSLEWIQAVADNAETKIVLTDDTVPPRVESLIDETPRLKRLRRFSTCRTPSKIEQQWEPPEINGNTLAILQYTSGSTGTPKGVMLSHTNLLHNSATVAHAFEHTRSGLGVFWLPSSHDMGLIGGILQPLYVGRPNVLLSPASFLQQPFRWLSAISRFGGTISGGSNFAYDLCMRKITPKQRKLLDLSTWRVAFNCAGPVREETMERFSEMFEPCGFRREAFYPFFGLAEATLMVSGGYVKKAPATCSFNAAALAAGKAIRYKSNGRTNGKASRTLVGCGAAMPDQQIVIADPKTMTRCPDGRIGEIWVAGPSISQGYWRKPDEIFNARLGETGEGPFLRTGEIGFVDGGELFVTGRIDGDYVAPAVPDVKIMINSQTVNAGM